MANAQGNGTRDIIVRPAPGRSCRSARNWNMPRRGSARLKRREAKHIYYSLSDTHLLRLVESAMEHAPAKQ
jgi:hypothetical protein